MKKIRSIVMIASLVISIYLMSLYTVAAATPSLDVHVEQITNNLWDDFCPVIDVDSSGDPHVAWAGSDGGYYAFKCCDSWHTTAIATEPAMPKSIQGWNKMSLCLDSQDRPHIAWANGPQIFYSSWNENEWVTEQVTDWSATEGAELAFVLDSHDKPHIVWDARYQGTWGIFYSERDGSDWTLEVISHHDDSHPSIALANNGIPHVAWNRDYRVSQGGVWHASREGGAWTAEWVIASPVAGSTSGQHIAVDSQGNLHIVAVNGSHVGPGWHFKTEILHLYKENGVWLVTQMVNGENRNWGPCVALDVNDKPSAAWSSNATGNYDIYRAEYKHSWIVYDISNQTIEEPRPNMAADTEGNMHVVWYGPHTGQGVAEIFYSKKHAGLEYVNETIRDLPDELFNRTAEDVPNIKEDFSDLFNDTFENINEGNYEGAIEKLNRIKEKIYEEIVESTEREELISMIDALIASIEPLL